MNIAIPRSDSPGADASVEIQNLSGDQSQDIINLRIGNFANSHKLRIFLDRDGQKREMVERINPSSHDLTIVRMIASALNTADDFGAALDAFEQRVIGLLIVGEDCVLSNESLIQMLSIFYDSFTSQDVDEAIADIRRKLVKFHVPVSIIGEPESGYRLHASARPPE